MNASNRTGYLPWLMWFFPLFFFAFQFVLRLFPGLILGDFFIKYQISAAEFGIYASFYYVGYAGMQIPMALLLDRFGPRIIISLSAFLCAIGVAITFMFDAFWVAVLSRFMIGVGSVVGFLGTSKVISIWFPRDRYARIVGLTFSFGLLGALYGGRPVSILIEKMGWERVYQLLGIISVIIGVVIYLFVRDKQTTPHQPVRVVDALKTLFTHRNLLILAFANLLMVGALEGFADVWGVTYLMESRYLSKIDASSITSFIYVGMLFGGPILAFFAERYRAHYAVTMISGLLMGVILGALLLFNTYIPTTLVIGMMVLTGILCCYQVVVFAIGAEIVSLELLSVTIALLNCINMLGGSLFHMLIGQIMNWIEPSTLVNGVQRYSAHTFAVALAIIPLFSILGGLLVWISRTHVNTQESR